jgi:hypothetical protein
MIAESGSGISLRRRLGATGSLATWQCTHSIGSLAVNGSAPTSIS